jgi:hypothetical protein
MMATPDELRAAIAEGRTALKDAIAAAAQGWERAPGGEGEASWTARQAAEHAIPVEAFFTSAVCSACGYPGVDEVKGSYPTAADALKHLDEVVEMCNKKLKYVSETDLEKKHERFGSAADLLAGNAKHLQEHAAQIRAAAGV